MTDHPKELTVGKRLQLARSQLAKKLSRKISQEDLANLCGWPGQSRISHYENDRRIPKGEDLMLMSKALLVQPEWILFGTDKNQNENNFASSHRNFSCVPLLNWMQIELWPKNPAEISQYIPTVTQAGPESFALIVNGDRMRSTGIESPSFPEGSMIIIDPNKPAKHRSFIVYKDLHLGIIDFKQLIIERNVQYLKILNSNYPEQIACAPSNLKIFGSVTEIINIL